MERAKEIVVSGIRPTGNLHLGNYFGAMRNYVRMQQDYECYFFVADWHSLTTHPDTAALRNSVLDALSENIAAGLDPEKCCLYLQSSRTRNCRTVPVPEHAGLQRRAGKNHHL